MLVRRDILTFHLLRRFVVLVGCHSLVQGDQFERFICWWPSEVLRLSRWLLMVVLVLIHKRIFCVFC